MNEAINGIDLHFEVHGDGEPVVLLHGFGGSGKAWSPWLVELGRTHRLIVVDLRGHGRSTNPAGTFTHRQAADDVLCLLDRLGLERVSAMGISTGAMTLLHMAVREPARIASMVLVSATTHFTAQARAIFRGASFETMPPFVREIYRESATRGDAQIRQLVAQFKAFHDDVDDIAFSAADLATIRARTLVVHGDRDAFFPVEIALDLYRGIPDAALWIVPGGDHVPIADPSLGFAAAALRFVEDPHGH